LNFNTALRWLPLTHSIPASIKCLTRGLNFFRNIRYFQEFPEFLGVLGIFQEFRKNRRKNTKSLRRLFINIWELAGQKFLRLFKSFKSI
jgi:hypothetical protein